MPPSVCLECLSVHSSISAGCFIGPRIIEEGSQLARTYRKQMRGIMDKLILRVDVQGVIAQLRLIQAEVLEGEYDTDPDAWRTKLEALFAGSPGAAKALDDRLQSHAKAIKELHEFFYAPRDPSPRRLTPSPSPARFPSSPSPLPSPQRFTPPRSPARLPSPPREDPSFGRSPSASVDAEETSEAEANMLAEALVESWSTKKQKIRDDPMRITIVEIMSLLKGKYTCLFPLYDKWYEGHQSHRLIVGLENRARNVYDAATDNAQRYLVAANIAFSFKVAEPDVFAHLAWELYQLFRKEPGVIPPGRFVIGAARRQLDFIFPPQGLVTRDEVFHFMTDRALTFIGRIPQRAEVHRLCEEHLRDYVWFALRFGGHGTLTEAGIANALKETWSPNLDEEGNPKPDSGYLSTSDFSHALSAREKGRKRFGY